MNTFRISLLYGLLQVVLTAPAQAGPPSALAGALDAAWQRAVVAREVTGQARVASANLAASGSRWAAPPSIELSQRENRLLRDTGQRETEVGLVWPVWLPGQRDARRTSALAEVALADVSAQVARLRLAGELRDLAWLGVARRAEVELAGTHVARLDALSADVDRRVQAGELARTDALAAQADAVSAGTSLREALQALAAAESRWTLLTGMPWPHSPDESPGGGIEIEQHPELVQARSALELVSRRLESVNLTRRDAPEVTLRYRHDEPGSGLTSADSIGVRLRIPLDTDDRNLARDAAAVAELERVRIQLERTRDRITAEQALAGQVLRTTEATLAEATTRAALLAERAALLDKAFRAGEGDLPELLRVRSAATQAQLDVARQQAALGLARARVNQSLGLLP
ncbi:TolC family protein [Methyloversatilis sp.]|uniref:TolC family protein n=1 Tax=Methyloversatilis sp. TaxID=2569862 RepID=UPI002734AA0B|nr:TolC family protein [Methyloversatilis sp.]MDP2869597.1 TolC family protein [Methyloversatilis sp.]MDP3456158.1 TolC family protein [Methyloversatilis sp.]MDP3577411.1 TolC family protein [Methyloversatilis sp.]